MIDPVDFFDAVSTYQENSGDGQPGNRFILATVHSYVSNKMKLVIDGEADPTAKTFSWIGQAPAVGKRVVVMSYHNTFLVLGELDNNTVAELNSYVAMLPRGVIARARLTAASAWVRNQSFLTGSAAIALNVDLDTPRGYKLYLSQANLAVDNAPCRVGVAMRVKSPSGTVTQFQESQILCSNTGRHDSIPCGVTFSPSEKGTHLVEAVVSTITSISGTYPQSRIFAASTMPCDLYAEDTGIYI